MLPSQNGGWQPHPIFPVMDEIVLHAKGREEASEIWLGQMKQTLVRTWMDKDLTLVTLKTVLDRVKKGEYLMNFDNTLNPEFTPMNLIRFPSNEYALPSSLRPNSLSTESLIQIHGFSEPADDERAFERKMREAIDGIARFYAKKHADCRAKADRWSRQMKDQLVGVSIAANAYALIRWNLIVAAEQVRCDQILPDSKDFFARTSALQAPQNVDPSDSCFFHSPLLSLGRISRRYAKITGYAGPAAEGGGLHYFKM